MAEKKRMKRSGTMQATAAEGAAFLDASGHLGISDPLSGVHQHETRAMEALHDAVQTISGPAKKKTRRVTGKEIEKYKKQVQMVFRMFHPGGGNASLTKEQLQDVLKGLGKARPGSLCSKITSAAADEKGLVSEKAFVDFMVDRKKLKDKEAKKKAAPKKRAAKKAPKKVPPAKRAKKEATPEKAEPEKAEPEKAPEPVKAPEPAKEGEDKQDKKDLARGLSFTDFFTEFAGLQEEIQPEAVDTYGNPATRAYDLGLESAFGQFSAILYPFYRPQDVFGPTVKALESKGFHVKLAQTEEEFITELPKYDEAWFAATSKSANSGHNKEKFVAAIKEFHERSGGLAIFADNEPYYEEANEILQEILGITLTGNTPGDKILDVTQDAKPSTGHFCKHLLTTGIVKLYEGVTICYPTSLPENAHVIGMSTDGHPSFFYVDYNDKKGRVYVDCGFTKLMPVYGWSKTPGTDRFVRNVGVWLLGLDHRIKLGKPLNGPLP